MNGPCPVLQACASVGDRMGCSPTVRAFCGTYPSSSISWRGSRKFQWRTGHPETSSPALRSRGYGGCRAQRGWLRTERGRRGREAQRSRDARGAHRVSVARTEGVREPQRCWSFREEGCPVRRRTLRSVWSHYLRVRKRLAEAEISGVERRMAEREARGLRDRLVVNYSPLVKYVAGAGSPVACPDRSIRRTSSRRGSSGS